MNYENLYMVRGDTFRFTIEIEGLNVPLTNAYFSCKKNKEDNEYIFQKSLSDGISEVQRTQTSRQYEIVVAPEDTEEVDAENYFYDLEIVVGDEVYTPLLGILKIDMDVTEEWEYEW